MSDDLNFEDILTWPEMADVRKELENPKYSNRTHGSRATYALKCHGPLCGLAEKLRGRARREKKANRQGRSFSENTNRKYDRDDLLLAIIAWHKRELAKHRLDGEEKSA